MEGKSLLRPAVLVLCVAATTLGLNNTYGDNSEVLAQAQKAACGKKDCSFNLLRESRSAFSHEYSFQTRLLQKSQSTESGTADVVCKREWLLLGDFKCHLKGGLD